MQLLSRYWPVADLKKLYSPVIQVHSDWGQGV